MRVRISRFLVLIGSKLVKLGRDLNPGPLPFEGPRSEERPKKAVPLRWDFKAPEKRTEPAPLVGSLADRIKQARGTY